MLWLSTFTSPMTLALDFQGQILKMLYLRNGMADWHGTKGMWVDRMLHPLCNFQLWPQPWPWLWIFKVKLWKCCISGMGWLIDLERKGCESIECLTHVVTLNVHLNHDLELGFSRSIFLIAIDRNARAHWHRTKVIWVDRVLYLLCGLFKVKYWNCCISRMGASTHLQWKGCELDMMLGAQWYWPWVVVHGKEIGQVMGQCETLTVSSLLPNEWAIRSLI